MNTCITCGRPIGYPPTPLQCAMCAANDPIVDGTEDPQVGVSSDSTDAPTTTDEAPLPEPTTPCAEPTDA